MTKHQDEREQSPKPVEGDNRPRLIHADDLFQGNREIWIELQGVRYRLRITRRHRLILQK